MKTNQLDKIVNKFYFIVILVFMIFFFVSHLKENKNTITDIQNKELNSTDNYSALIENN
jgi:hypothetical protein